MFRPFWLFLLLSSHFLKCYFAILQGVVFPLFSFLGCIVLNDINTNQNIIINILSVSTLKF